VLSALDKMDITGEREKSCDDTTSSRVAGDSCVIFYFRERCVWVTTQSERND